MDIIMNIMNAIVPILVTLAQQQILSHILTFLQIAITKEIWYRIEKLVPLQPINELQIQWVKDKPFTSGDESDDMRLQIITTKERYVETQLLEWVFISLTLCVLIWNTRKLMRKHMLLKVGAAYIIIVLAYPSTYLMNSFIIGRRMHYDCLTIAAMVVFTLAAVAVMAIVYLTPADGEGTVTRKDMQDLKDSVGKALQTVQNTISQQAKESEYNAWFTGYIAALKNAEPYILRLLSQSNPQEQGRALPANRRITRSMTVKGVDG
jgi:hypothetical protein